MIEATIYNKLSSASGLTALVSDRIYPTVAEENIPALPFVVYRVSATQSHLTLAGVDTTKTYTVELDIYGRDKADVDAVAAQTAAALTFRSPPTVQACYPTDEAGEEIQMGYACHQVFTAWGAA